MYTRKLILPKTPKKSFFLWGPRQSGKTTLLKNSYPDAYFINLLQSEESMGFTKRPSWLRERLAELPSNQLVVIDEIQKVPDLLDEVHHLIETTGRCFALCGSSARKVKRGHANLLGGRAYRFELLGLSAAELQSDFDIIKFCNRGPLPSTYLDDDYKLAVRAYVTDYLKEEVLQEGLVRSIPDFSDFLRVAAIGDTEQLNYQHIAREAVVAASTVRNYYQIMCDTLLAAMLPAWTKRAKRRVISSPKFYFRDVGIVGHLSRRKNIEPGSTEFGRAFENWLFHELSVHSMYTGEYYELSYWRTSSGFEVDFILGDMTIAIEAKGKERVTTNDLKGLEELQKDFPSCQDRIVVSLETQSRTTDSGIRILPHEEFIRQLWQGAFLP